MPVQLFPAAAMTVTVVASGIAVYHWRRAASLYALLVEGANRYEELRQRGATLEQTLRKNDEQLKIQTEASKRFNLGLDEARAQTATLTQRLEQKEHEIRLVTEKLELQKGHLERQLTKTQEQLGIAEEQRLGTESQVNSLRVELTNVRRSAQEDKARLSQELTLREKDWQARMFESEKAKAAAEKQAKVGDPLELRRLKRKAAQYERLYNSMKGLRELSDERNRNWEVALRKLSAWIVEEKGLEPAPTAIGPLVGTAMQAIGAQLIDEIETDTRDGAEARIHEIPDLADHEESQAHAEG